MGRRRGSRTHHLRYHCGISGDGLGRVICAGLVVDIDDDSSASITSGAKSGIPVKGRAAIGNDGRDGVGGKVGDELTGGSVYRVAVVPSLVGAVRAPVSTMGDVSAAGTAPLVKAAVGAGRAPPIAPLAE